MSNTPLVLVKNLSKAFLLYKKPVDLLYEVFKKDFKADYFWALKDISFSMYEGDRIGIVGSNGAGKSTLLSILTGFLPPTSGKVEVNGKITSMLSLTTFLDEKKTGIENILFNFEVLQLNKSKVRELLEEIVDFTELEDFIYAPVQTYSSGMKARLAFAISTAFVPDILVIDEVLSVGDSYFVGKATERMKKLCDKGRGLLYVSHSAGAIEMLCTKALWLDHGSIRMFGSAREVMIAYEEYNKKKNDIATRKNNKQNHAKRLMRVQKAEYNDFAYWRFRIIPEKGLRFCDKHYIHKITATVGDQKFEISLKNIGEDNSSNLDIKVDFFNSQWGAVYEKKGKEARAITNVVSSFLKGAHFSIRKPLSSNINIFDISLQIIYCSEHNLEALHLEYLDEEHAEWTQLTPTHATSTVSIADPWKEIEFKGSLKSLNKESYFKIKKDIESLDEPNIKIINTCLLSKGMQVSKIKESEPFSIVVLAQITRFTPIYDIQILIRRGDSLYMFWSTTSFSKEKLPAQPGLIQVEFFFDPNLFSGGDYYVDVFSANGFDLEKNYPQSEVFDRKLNMLLFKVERKFSNLDFGAINQKINIKVSKIPPNTIKKIAS